jgi:hypothetical protein
MPRTRYSSGVNQTKEYVTKKEWINAVDAYKAEHGTTRGFQTKYTDSNGVVWDYTHGSNGGPGGARRATATGSFKGRRHQNEIDQTLGASNLAEAKRMFDEAGREAGVVSGEQMHHMRTLNAFEPLLAGLSAKDRIAALKWFAAEGFPLGNLKGNLLKQFMNRGSGGTTIRDTHQGKGSIHAYMRHHGMEPKTNENKYKTMRSLFEGKTLNERLPMFVDYLKYVQGDLQEKLNVPTKYTERDKLEQSVGTIPSGPRKGERMPVNTRTLRDAEIRRQGEALLDTMLPRPGQRNAAKTLGYAPVGTTKVGDMEPGSVFESPIQQSGLGWVQDQEFGGGGQKQTIHGPGI